MVKIRNYRWPAGEHVLVSAVRALTILRLGSYSVVPDEFALKLVERPITIHPCDQDIARG